MDSGALVPDDLIISLMQEETQKSAESSDGNVRALLDGFPRTAPQAQALKQAGVTVDMALNLEV